MIESDYNYAYSEGYEAAKKELQSTHSKDIGELIQGLKVTLPYVKNYRKEFEFIESLIQKHSSNT